MLEVGMNGWLLVMRELARWWRPGREPQRDRGQDLRSIRPVSEQRDDDVGHDARCMWRDPRDGGLTVGLTAELSDWR